MTNDPVDQQRDTPPVAEVVASARGVRALAIASLACGIVGSAGALLLALVALTSLQHFQAWNEYDLVTICSMPLAGMLGLLLGIIAILKMGDERTATKRIAFLGTKVSLAACTLLAAILFLGGGIGPSIDGPGYYAMECENNLRQLNGAAINYATDYKGHLPPADSWPKYLVKGGYIMDETLLCPVAREAGRGYAINANLRGLKIDDIRQRSSTVLFFECAPGSPPAGGPELLPPEPRYKDPSGCFVFGFADGHAEWVSPKNLGQLNWDPKAE